MKRHLVQIAVLLIVLSHSVIGQEINGFIYDTANSKYINPNTKVEFVFKNGVYVSELPPINGKPNGVILTRDTNGAFYEVGYLVEGGTRVTTYYAPISDGYVGQQRLYSSLPQAEKDFVIQDLVAPTWEGGTTYLQRMQKPPTTSEPRQYGSYPETGYASAAGTSTATDDSQAGTDDTPQEGESEEEPTLGGGTSQDVTAGQDAERAAQAWLQTIDGSKVATALGSSYTVGAEAQIIDSRTGAVYYPDGEGYFSTYPDASGARTRLYVDGEIVREVRIDRDGKVVGGWTHTKGTTTTDSSAIGSTVQQLSSTGIAPPRVEPPPVSGSTLSGLTLSDEDKATIANTPDKSKLVTYIGTDGKLHVATTDIVTVASNGAVSTMTGVGARPVGNVVPPYVAQDFLSSPTATLSTTAVSGQNRYVVSSFKEDKSITNYVDYRREVTTTYEGQVGPNGELPQTYTAHIEVVDKKDDVLTAGYTEVRREQTFVQQTLVNGKYVTERTGTEIQLGSGRTVQIGTDYVSGQEAARIMRANVPSGASPEERRKIEAEATRLAALPTTERIPGDTIVIRVNGETVGQLQPGGDFTRESTVTEPTVRDALVARLTAILGDEGKANEEADKIIRQARFDRAQRHGSFLSDVYRQRPGESNYDWIGRIVGGVMQTYDKLGGIGRLSTLFMGDFASKNREALEKSFCGFAGIQTCFVSAICGEIHEITSSNVLVGTDAKQNRINSASLNAERSEAVLLQGLSRQELIDILGNASSLGGRYVDLTDPTFRPELLGPLKLRLYHVEYSISNRLPEEQVMYNVEFRKLTAPVIIATTIPNRTATADEYQGDYAQYLARTRNVNNQGTVSAVSWFPERKILKTGKTDHDHLQKYSSNEYDAACLVFNPGLPSGKSASSGTVKEFCVPFTEYQGGATVIQAAGNGTTQAPPPQTTGTTQATSAGRPPPVRSTVPGSQV